MSGKYIGAAKIFQDEFPQAIYVHCASHRLNLCIANSCKIPIMKNLFSVMKRVHDFFNWPKQQNILVTTLKDVNPDAKQLKLLDMCKTRWVERIDSLRIFESLFEGIVVTLEKIIDNIDGTWSSDAIIDAGGSLCCSFFIPVCHFSGCCAEGIRAHVLCNSTTSRQSNGYCQWL